VRIVLLALLGCRPDAGAKSSSVKKTQPCIEVCDRKPTCVTKPKPQCWCFDNARGSAAMKISDGVPCEP